MDSVKFNYYFSPNQQKNSPSFAQKPDDIYDDDSNNDSTIHTSNSVLLLDDTSPTIPTVNTRDQFADANNFSAEQTSTAILPTTSWARHHYGLLFSASTTSTSPAPPPSHLLYGQNPANFFSTSTTSAFMFDWLGGNNETFSSSSMPYVFIPSASSSISTPVALMSTSPRIMPPSAQPTVDLCSDKTLSKIFGVNELPWILSYGFVVTALAVLLNIIVITSFILTPELRRLPQNFYILNLSLSDLLVAVNSLPARITFDMMSCWPHSYTLCRIYQIFNWISFNESAFTMILIAFDRLQMVRLGPFYRTKETRNVVMLKIGASWLIQILIYVPSNFYDWVTGISISRLALGNCMPEFMQSRELAAAIFIVSSIAPPLCLVFVYTAVYSALRKKQTHLQTAPSHTNGRMSTIETTVGGPSSSATASATSKARTSSLTDVEQFELENAPNSVNNSQRQQQHSNGNATSTTALVQSHAQPHLRTAISSVRNYSTTSSIDSPTTRLLAAPSAKSSTSFLSRSKHKPSIASEKSITTKIMYMDNRKDSSGSSYREQTVLNKKNCASSGRQSPPEHAVMLDVASAVVGAGGMQMLAVPSSMQQHQSRAGQREMQRLRRAARSMVLLTVIFLCVWMPYGVILCLTLLIQCTSCMTSTATREALKKIFRISLYVMMSDSAINPILYAIAFPAIRQAMIKTFCPRSLCKRLGIGNFQTTQSTVQGTQPKHHQTPVPGTAATKLDKPANGTRAE